METKSFSAKAATRLAVTLEISEQDKNALGITVNELAKKFQAEHPEYAQCSHTYKFNQGKIVISFWLTSEVIFEEA